MAVASALDTLVAANPKELHRRRADGSRGIDALYTACVAAGLAPSAVGGAAASSIEARYCAVFNAALANGLGCWVSDYVEEVCADKHLTSSEPVEAYLLDGEFVKLWCSQNLAAAEQAVVAALSNEPSYTAFVAGPLGQHLSKVNVLVCVLQALDGIRAREAQAAAASGTAVGNHASGSERLTVKPELRQALLLQQCFQVMDWCTRHRVHARASATGRHSSFAEWTRSVQARRARAAPRALFLDTHLAQLKIAGAYPSASLQTTLHTLLLVVRDIEEASWHAKLALLLYHLMDLGMLGHGPGGSLASGAGGGLLGGQQGGVTPAGAVLADAEARLLEDFRSTFGLPPAVVGSWQCQFWLDCAEPGNRWDPLLQRACETLPACVTPSTPYAFLQALLALGAPEVALAAHKAQMGGGADAHRTLEEASVLLDIRLRCGLMTEAFLYVRGHCGSLGDAAARRAHCNVLLSQLAGWALEHSGPGQPLLHKLTELPFTPLEEEVLVSWLVGQAEGGSSAGDHLPLYFLQRGRTVEALAAWHRWEQQQQRLAAEGKQPSPLSDLIGAAIDAAFRALPQSLQNISIPGDLSAPLPPVTAPASTSSAGAESAEQAGQGAVGVLRGLYSHMHPDVPLATLPFRGQELPPLITSCVRPVLRTPAGSYQGGDVNGAGTGDGGAASGAMAADGGAYAAAGGDDAAAGVGQGNAGGQAQQGQGQQPGGGYATLFTLGPENPWDLSHGMLGAAGAGAGAASSTAGPFNLLGAAPAPFGFNAPAARAQASQPSLAVPSLFRPLGAPDFSAGPSGSGYGFGAGGLGSFVAGGAVAGGGFGAQPPATPPGPALFSLGGAGGQGAGMAGLGMGMGMGWGAAQPSKRPKTSSDNIMRLPSDCIQ